jgi:signal peptidase I
MRRHWTREYFEALLIAGIFLAFTNTYLIKTFYIPSGSMENTMLVGDHLFVDRFIYGNASALERKLLPSREIERGDIVVFRSPENPTVDLVKRCIGLPGDRIEVVSKRLLINGQEARDLDFAIHRDAYTFPKREGLSSARGNRDFFGPFVVPEGHYFFLGDNRDNSHDSRFWGSVPRHYIKGRASMIYWSFGGDMSEKTDKLQGLFGILRTAVALPTETRWSRTFHLPR